MSLKHFMDALGKGGKLDIGIPLDPSQHLSQLDQLHQLRVGQFFPFPAPGAAIQEGKSGGDREGGKASWEGALP